MADESFPDRPFPCNEMLATWPSELQATPSKEPSHGKPLRVQEER